jgi:hypothetical protein
MEASRFFQLPVSRRRFVTLGRGLHLMSTISLSCITPSLHRFLTASFLSAPSSIVDVLPTLGLMTIAVLQSEASDCLSVKFAN